MLVGEIYIDMVVVIISVMVLLLRFFIYDRKTHSDFVECIQYLCIMIDMFATTFILYMTLHYLFYGTLLY